jgi:hypothetical protein
VQYQHTPKKKKKKKKKSFFFFSLSLSSVMRSAAAYGSSAASHDEHHSDEAPAWTLRPYVKPGPPAFPDANQDAKWLALEKKTGIPADQLADPHLHHWTMRAEALLDELKVPEAERDAWLDKYTLSPGNFTLEWALPSPPPVHGFSEPPAVKEMPDGDSHH